MADDDLDETVGSGPRSEQVGVLRIIRTPACRRLVHAAIPSQWLSPTLYEVLSPLEERTACFYLGDLEYDPVKVGYKVQTCADGERPGEFKI